MHTNCKPLYTVHRADVDPTVARKQTIRLLATYTLLWLPVHCGICWLASYSLGLAAAAVTVASFAAAFAKWLGLEDLLQKLPLIVGLGLILVGLAFLPSLPNLKAWGGFEFFGVFTILIMVISILSGLYRPMAAAYQTVTLKTPSQDLCVSAVAMRGLFSGHGDYLHFMRKKISNSSGNASTKTGTLRGGLRANAACKFARLPSVAVTMCMANWWARISLRNAGRSVSKTLPTRRPTLFTMRELSLS